MNTLKNDRVAALTIADDLERTKARQKLAPQAVQRKLVTRRPSLLQRLWRLLPWN